MPSNLTCIVRPPTVIVVSIALCVVFTRRTTKPPALTGPTWPLNLPEAVPTMPSALSTNAPSPSLRLPCGLVMSTLMSASPIRVRPAA